MTSFRGSVWNRQRTIGCLLLLWISVRPARAQVEEFVLGIQADQLILNRQGSLVWKADAQLATNGVSISSVPVDNPPGSRGHLLFGPALGSPTPGAIDFCDPTRSEFSDWSIIFFRGNGLSLAREDRYFIAARLAGMSFTPLSRLATYGDKVFFTQESGEFLDSGVLLTLTMGNTVTTNAVVVADRSTGPDATWFRSLIAVSDSEVLALMGNNRLQRFVRGFLPIAGETWFPYAVSSNAFCMVEHELTDTATSNRLVWATINTAQTHVTFYSAPMTNLSAAVLLGTEATPTPLPFESMTVADNRLFYQIGSSLRRRSAVASDATSEEIAALDHEARQLCSTDRFVCWLRNGNTIMRLPVGAAAVSRDLGIAGMEVIQAIQSPSNDVPLVAAKPTHVRVFARLLASSAGETSLNLPSPMVLHGFRGSSPLPGSPLLPDVGLSGSRSIATNPPIRLDVAAATNEPPWAHPQDGFWFRLPETWTTEGTTVLQAQLNPSRVLRETNYANNVRTVNAVFAQKAPIGVKIIPSRTHYGIIDRRRSDHREIFEQAALLLPTSELRVEYPRTTPIEERDGFLGLDGTSPYEFEPGDDDKESVLLALFWRKVEGVGGTLAEPGGFDHYLTFIPDEALRLDYSGFASIGDDISVTHASLLVRHELTHNRHGTRSRAVSLAHELGHNYGRPHVAGCGDPSGTDSSYPYAGGIISDESAAHLGFNDYRRKLLPLSETGDMMSYCENRWISAYTWKKLFNRVANGYGPALFVRLESPIPTSINTYGLVGGVINLTNGTATIRPVFDLGADAWARAVAGAGTPGATYQIRAYEGAVLKGNFAVGEFYADDDGSTNAASNRRAWVSALGDLTGVDSIKLVSLQNPAVPLVTVNGGKVAPTVVVHKPEAGPVTNENLNIEWTSADDGPGPLSHVVRVSPDAGATWRVLASEYTGRSLTVPVADLPGGETCRVEVVASDGILCGRGVSADFQIPNHAPSVRILCAKEHQPIPTPLTTLVLDYGERVILHAETDDVEDGWIPGSRLQWYLSGPSVAVGTGRRFEPRDLPTGSYYGTLTATDSGGVASIATIALVVRSAYLENASGPIEIDGRVEEDGYSADRWPRRLTYPDAPDAPRVSIVRNGDFIVIAVTGLLRGKDENHRLVVGLDPGAGSWDAPGTDSLKVEVTESGVTHRYRGNGSGWDPSTNGTGIATALSGDTDRWNVEICIEVSELPSGFEALSGRFFAGVYDRQSLGDSTTFPSNSSPDVPGTWSEFAMSPDPDPPQDADGDGMPDQWERDTFGPNGSWAGSDSDTDGVPDDEEYIAGTDPTDRDSAFLIQNGDLHWISWEGKPGRTYSVWRATDAIHFEEVAEGISPYPYGRTRWLDADPPDGPVYYRVHAHYYR